MKNKKGFTLIELMIVVSIIGILAAIATPQYSVYMRRSEVADALSMGSHVKEHITAYYVENLDFPENNKKTGLPEPSKLIGNRITSVTIVDGAFHIKFGNKSSKLLQNKILTFRPATVNNSPTSPISWLCGYATPVEGMSAIGQNKTDIPTEYLTSTCKE
jgi:type IV pilus assembly protein PilA